MRIAPDPLDDALAPGLPTGFEAKLDDGFAIAAYIEEWSPGDVDAELMEDYFRGGVATLRMVPVAEIAPGNPDANQRIASRERKYARMDPATMPPLVVMDGQVQDGNHRLRVALARGATHLPCYVVEFD